MVEALGCLGGALASVRVNRRESDLAGEPASAELAFAAGGAVALLGAGAAIRQWMIRRSGGFAACCG